MNKLEGSVPLDAGKKLPQPRRKGGGIQHTSHQVGLDQARRQEVRAGGLALSVGVAVVQIPLASLGETHVGQRGDVMGTRVVDGKGDSESAVRVHAVADRIRRFG